MKVYILAITALLGIAEAQKSNQQYTTPVPILKQINKHNEDGSYSYGYEAADGTYKIETKYPNGEVYGKYGYVDDAGKVRTVEYGASRRGFEPAGNEIQVPPPTLKESAARPLAANEEDDGQYREDPGAYYKAGAKPSAYQPNYSSNSIKPTSYDRGYQPSYQSKQADYDRGYDRGFGVQAYKPTYNNNNNDNRVGFGTQTYQPAYQPPSYQPENRYNYVPRYNQAAPPTYPNYQPFQGHPATNVDIVSGSYSVNYR